MNDKLCEMQLRSNILRDLVLPQIKIDTYTPKIKKDSIVVVFEVQTNYDAAYDLSSFIEKLPYGIIDTEAQDIPGTNGNYKVFVEFDRDVNFPSNLMNVLQDINKLSNEQEYTAEFFNQEAEIAVDAFTIKKYTRLVPEVQIVEFLAYSNSKVQIQEKFIKLTSTSHSTSSLYECVNALNDEEVIAYLKEYWETPARESIAVFGKLYEVYKVRDGMIVGKDGEYFIFR